MVNKDEYIILQHQSTYSYGLWESAKRSLSTCHTEVTRAVATLHGRAAVFISVALWRFHFKYWGVKWAGGSLGRLMTGRSRWMDRVQSWSSKCSSFYYRLDLPSTERHSRRLRHQSHAASTEHPRTPPLPRHASFITFVFIASSDCLSLASFHRDDTRHRADVRRSIERQKLHTVIGEWNWAHAGSIGLYQYQGVI